MNKTDNKIWKWVISAFLVFITIIDISAARYITVATIGATPSVDRKQEPQKIVDQVKEFWQRKLSYVLPDKPDLILLPEVCDMSGGGVEYLRVRKNQIIDYFASVARDHNCYIAFGMKREENDGTLRNSCVLLNRDGTINGIYDKYFPTTGEMERGIKAGKEAPIFQCDFGKVAIAICFDLNFDELREKYVIEQPDLILFSSMYHGGIVQSQWAYSCRSFFVGSLYYGTPSEIRNPLGDVIASTTNYLDYAVGRINLDCELVHLDFNQPRFNVLKEKYGSKVTINDPGKLGVVLLTSEHENVSVAQMIEEAHIELLDDYFNRVRNFRLKPGIAK